MAIQDAKQDRNQFPAKTLHSGTAETSTIIRATGQANGAQNVFNTGGTISEITAVGAIGAGTLNTLGTVGVLESGTTISQFVDTSGSIVSIIDGVTRSVLTVEHEHHEIHSGGHYFVSGYQDLSINNVLDFTWLMPNTTKWIHWTWDISTEHETNWLVYENGTATNPLANTITPLNNNRNSVNTSATTLKYELQSNLAAANADTNVTGATLIESGISGAGRDAGFAKRSNELMLKQNTLYCLRAIATVAGYINFTMEWYEHTNR